MDLQLKNGVVRVNKSDYEKREIYDFEVYKPLQIEMAIKNKDLIGLRDDLLIYSSSVEDVLGDSNLFQPRPSGLDQMLIFLKLAVKSYNLHVLRAVWIYGIQVYFKYQPDYWSEVILFISDLIYENDNSKMLKFLINKVKFKNLAIKIKTSDKVNELSGGRRNYVFGNLLDAAIYYNNTVAMEMLLEAQVKNENNSLKDYLENSGSNVVYMDALNSKQEFRLNCNPYSQNLLYSNNPIAYAFDNGNTKAIEILIESGYTINFQALDFTYELANFAHINTIKYLYKNYPEEFKNLDINVILKSSNYILLRIILNSGLTLGNNSLNLILTFNNSFHVMNDDSYDLIKAKNIEKCIGELARRNLKFNNMEFALIYSFYTKSYNFLDKCISLYGSNQPMDITPILTYLKRDIDMFKHLSEKIKLNCRADDIKKPLNIGIRDFNKLLGIINFNIEKKNTINEITKDILDLNAVTSIKILHLAGFIRDENCNDAVDYIVEQGLEKLLPRLITHFSNIGGLEKNYDI